MLLVVSAWGSLYFTRQVLSFITFICFAYPIILSCIVRRRFWTIQPASFQTISFVVISLNRIFETLCFIGVLSGLIECILLFFFVHPDGLMPWLDLIIRGSACINTYGGCIEGLLRSSFGNYQSEGDDNCS